MFDSFYGVWYVMLCHSRFFLFKRDVLKNIPFLYFPNVFFFFFYEYGRKPVFMPVKVYPGQTVCDDCVILCFRLSEISPVVRGALETPASVVYLNTLMEELGLHEQDLLNLVRMFKTQTH